MKTVNSISGGKTSAYLAAHYPADIEIFSLVRIEDPECLWMEGKDEKTRQLISDRIGCEFIGTAEMDAIIYTILDLEQFLGREIKIITGKTFEQVIRDASNYLPNKMVRFCTSEMKFLPIFNYLRENIELPCIMNIGYRPSEKNRIKKIKAKAKADGLEYVDGIIGKRKTQNKWGEIPYRFVKLPLVEDNIQKDTIYHYWENKPVRFAYRNNCVMCVNRDPLQLSHMASKDRRKIEWAAKIEKQTGNTFLSDVSMSRILRFSTQGNLFDDSDFSDDCEDGCGI